MMHLVLVIAIVIILAASCLLTFALCRAATRRDMLESQIARFPIRAYFTDVLGLSDIYARSKEAVGLAYLAGCGVNVRM